MSWPSAYIIPLVAASAVLGTLSLVCGFVAGYAGHLEAAEANEAAAQANERAAELNKTAEQLRLDLERERSKTAARPWTQEQFEAIQDVKGLVKDVGLLWESHCVECGSFASHLMNALTLAGVQIWFPRVRIHSGIFDWNFRLDANWQRSRQSPVTPRANESEIEPSFNYA
jgi:hypothetical protein